MTAPDIVYVVGPDPVNDELRHSLRSLENTPHRRVWIAGYAPEWVSDEVGVIPVPQRGQKWANSTANLRAACGHPDVSDEFVYMNDDMFLLGPIDEVPVLHRGPLDEFLREYANKGGPATYWRGASATAEVMRRMGLTDPLSYELHVPMPVRKAAMIEAIDLGSSVRTLHKRTLYGNMAAIGGEQSIDFKVSSPGDRWSPEWPFISTSDKAWTEHDAGDHVRAMYAEPCVYERAGSRSRTTEPAMT